MEKKPEEMTFDELRAAAELEAAEPTQKAEEVTQVAEVKTEPAAVSEPEQEEEITVYRRTIDLGDGSGVQVFEAESPEELVDKLAEAQTHATKKIREQAAELTERRAKDKPQPVEITPEQEVIYSQELLKNPTKAFKDMFKALTGESIEEFRTVKQRTDAIEEVKQRDAAASKFIASHPDYQDNARNGQLINMHLKAEGLKYSSENFHQAYVTLSKGGLLELKTAQENVGTEQTEPKVERIAQPKATEVTTQRTKKGSGLHATRTAVVAQPSEPSEDELRTMPLEKLKALANRQLLASRA